MAAVRTTETVPIGALRPREILPVGALTFVVRGSVNGSLRFASEGELAAAREVKVGGDGPVRGAFAVAGPPAHTLLDLFFPDVAVAAGDFWRAVTHVPEPGTAMDFVVEGEGLVISVEHTERALIVTAASVEGLLHARSAYDPFAFIDGITAACERLDRFFRVHGMTESSQMMYRQFGRPAFPRCVSVET